MATATTNRRICVAKVGAPHGTSGEVKLWPFTADPLAVGLYGELETADGMRRFKVESLRPARDFLIARLKGVSNRIDAGRLRNLELFVPRSRLPEIEQQDEFYQADLIGLAAVDRSGAPLGIVIAVHNFGAGDILELRLHDASDTVLIPFTQATVPEIDLPAGSLVVELEFSEGEPSSRAGARGDRQAHRVGSVRGPASPGEPSGGSRRKSRKARR